jgi:hypothetical protein
MNHSWMLLAVFGCAAAMADSDNNATINNSGTHYNGVVTINQAAGDQQQLSNNVVIAVGRNAQAHIAVTQKTAALPPTAR